MKSTIKKILKYEPISEYDIEMLRKIGIYNGTGTGELLFDDLIDEVFRILKKAKIFSEKKGVKLRRDIQQLVLRHDVDTHFKIGFFRANRRLSSGLYKLLHKFPFIYRIGIRLVVFYVVNCTKKARNNYFK